MAPESLKSLDKPLAFAQPPSTRSKPRAFPLPGALGATSENKGEREAQEEKNPGASEQEALCLALDAWGKEDSEEG